MTHASPASASTDTLAVRADELRAVLATHDSPTRRAFERLRPNRHQWTQQLYDTGAQSIWERQSQENPGDMEVVHHLAILHHARAFDLENDSRYELATADWERALTYWHRLWRDDTYWATLANQLDDDLEDPFPDLRAALPFELLRVHFDIAFNPATDVRRSRTHVRLALGSRFPHEAKDAVRHQAYDRLTQEVGTEVWEAHTLDPSVLERAFERITHYLDRDSSLPRALRDLVDISVRLQSGLVATHNASNANNSSRHLARAREIGFRTDAYLTPIEQALSLYDDNTLANLQLWLHRTGHAQGLLGYNEHAAAYFQRAHAVAAHRADESGLTETLGAWVTATLQAAHERCRHGDLEAARRMCDDILRHQPENDLALWIRARCFYEAGRADA